MQQFKNPTTSTTSVTSEQMQGKTNDSRQATSSDSSVDMQEIARAAERARLRQGIMHVRIRHFYCTLEESFDESLRGQSFVVGTGTGRPNEPGRVIDASPAAMRLGITSGMPLRRAHRIASRTRFLSASYDRYQPFLQQLRERYRAYSRIIESIPIADSFIDLRGCELPFDSPVALAERLCAEIAEIGLTALIGIADGKAIAELAALMSRKDGRQGVLYIPPGREASFVQTLPLSLLLQLRTAGIPGLMPELGEQQEENSSLLPSPFGKSEQIDSSTVTELVAHLRDFGITTFAQVATLTPEGVTRRLGRLGSWVHQVSNGKDSSIVVPDAPPVSQNARVRFPHATDADETCTAIRKLANYLGERLREQRLKGKTISLLMVPHHSRRKAQELMLDEEGEEMEGTPAGETVGGQMTLSQSTDDPDVIAQHSLMLFAHYHRPANRYLQVQLRIGDILATTPVYYPPPARARNRATRKLGN